LAMVDLLSMWETEPLGLLFRQPLPDAARSR
jgi:hypothetical protein